MEHELRDTWETMRMQISFQYVCVCMCVCNVCMYTCVCKYMQMYVVRQKDNVEFIPQLCFTVYIEARCFS